MTNLINVATASMPELIEFFNANTGGNPVKRFADRKNAERRVAALLEEMAEEVEAAKGLEAEAIVPIGMGKRSTAKVDHTPSNKRIAALLAEDKPSKALGRKLALTEPKDRVAVVKAASLIDGQAALNSNTCPKCGGHELYCGHAPKGVVIDEEYVTGCHSCDWEVDSRKVGKKADKVEAPVGARPAMAESMKIVDRRIVDLLTGDEYKNACQVWKAGLVSAAQGDRLSAVLYGAFKATGKRDATVEINGHTFRLAF